VALVGMVVDVTLKVCPHRDWSDGVNCDSTECVWQLGWVWGWVDCMIGVVAPRIVTDKDM